jgi:hypothetical protein
MNELERACSPNGEIFNNYKGLKKNPSWKIPLLDSKVQTVDRNEVELQEAEFEDICKDIHS